MRKSKSNSTKITANENDIYWTIKNGFKVYPVKVGKSWFIESDNNGTITRFKKAIKESEINDSIAATIKFYSDKIVNLKKK